MILNDIAVLLSRIAEVAHVADLPESHPECLEIFPSAWGHGEELFASGKHGVQALESTQPLSAEMEGSKKFLLRKFQGQKRLKIQF